MSLFHALFSSAPPSKSAKPNKHARKHSHPSSPSLTLTPALYSSRRQLEKEDEALYGPPSPNPITPSVLVSTHLGQSTFFPPSLSPLASPASSPILAPDPSSPTDELFLSQHYPPIHARHYPYYSEKLVSPPRGMVQTHQSHPPTISLAIAHTWARIARNLSRTFPELAETLSYPADEAAISRLDSLLAIHRLEIPSAVRASLLTHDGQDVFSRSSIATHGLVWGLWLMSCEEVEAEWGFWRRLDGGQLPGDAFNATDFSPAATRSGLDGSMSSCPAGWVRELYAHPGWLPLLSDRVGNYIGVDLSPPMVIDADEQPMGGGQGNARPAPGQVIAFGREIDEKVVLWCGDGSEGWAHWLSAFADDLEQGNFAHPGGLGPGLRRRQRQQQQGSEEGWQAAGTDEEDDEEEGLGEVGYFTGSNGYGVESDEAEFKGWKLAGEYRGMSIIEALCARSKRRWAEMGLYSSRESKSPLRPTRSSIASGSSTVHPNPVDEHQSPDAPIAFVTPPSPRVSSDQPPEPSHHSPAGLTPRQPLSSRPRRRPPPPPATISLPTMDDMMRAGSEEEEETLSPAATVGRFVAAGLRRMSQEVSEEEQIGMGPIKKDESCGLGDLSLGSDQI